jgi:hypothetical protein
MQCIEFVILFYVVSYSMFIVCSGHLCSISSKILFHVGEVVLSHVFDDLQIETSKSPDVMLFLRFRKNYELLQSCRVDSEEPASSLASTSAKDTAMGIVFSCKHLSGLDESQFSDAAKVLVREYRDNVLELARSEISFCRDDYKEFIELSTVFLDGKDQRITFKQPGALHKARWMAKLIYSIKICLLEQQINELPRGTITVQQQVAKVRDFANFTTLIYSSWWMTCNSAADAPWNDLNFFRALLRYEAIHPVISASAIRAFKNHQWYLTAEMVPLALFSNKVPKEDRRSLADRLLVLKPTDSLHQPTARFGSGFGKPTFPTTITLTTTLADLVDVDSWFTFELLKLDGQFLNEAVDDWSNCASYQASLTNLQALNVVNDCAERGVKLSSDFLPAAKSEEHFQNVLQVAEHDRKQLPNLRSKRKKIAK